MRDESDGSKQAHKGSGRYEQLAFPLMASKEEFSLLLKGRTSDDAVAVCINETARSVEALAEGT
jgi:hypothetical protein